MVHTTVDDNHLPTVMPDWLSSLKLTEFGSWASILSLALTLWILIAVRKLRSQYVFKGTVPKLVEKLSTHSSQISSYLNDYKGSKSQIDLEIARTEVVLQSLKRQLPRRHRKPVNSLLRSIKKSRDPTEYQVRRIYLASVQIVDQVLDLQEDLAWRT